MLFHSAQFFAFLLVVLASFYAVPFRAGKLILLAASYAFYMAWNPRFVWLLLTLTVIDYWAARLMNKLMLTVSITANLAFLGFFKYYNFVAIETGHLPLLAIVLPLGISFHTFQSISYVVDVYRGEQAAIRYFPDYALFISFFPQLVAGPIVRAREFFADLDHWTSPAWRMLQEGTLLFLIGLTKKLVFADPFGMVSDSYFGNVRSNPGSLAAWTGAFAFAMQIFFDFSGYTDMAIGLAKLFGFHFPENFARPYLSASVTEFWRRWHMSLSRWLRDYLYIPLGGNRHGQAKTLRNLMLTMLLGGLWHGANWNFVLWGGWHGMLLSGERLAQGRVRCPYLLRWVATFAVVIMGWVLFRARNLSDAAYVFGQMFQPAAGACLLTPGLIALTMVALAGAVAEERWAMCARFPDASWGTRVGVLFVLFLALEYCSAGVERSFLYFQF